MRRKGESIVLYVILSLLLIAIAVFLGVYHKPHPSVAREEAAFKVSASHLVEAFSKDEMEANARYAGKILEVRGPLREMIVDDSTTVLLMGDSNLPARVSCYLQPGQEEAARNLKEGESIAVKGICNGILLDVILDRAILLEYEQ